MGPVMYRALIRDNRTWQPIHPDHQDGGLTSTHRPCRLSHCHRLSTACDPAEKVESACCLTGK
jgi:hypothetical protein